MESLKVGIIGAGWMGHVHARAYQRLTQHWPDLAVRPELVAVADSSAVAAETFGRAHGVATYADWRELLADPDLAAVSVTAPNFLHREIGVAVAEAGKHLWIEKPVGLTAADAVAVRDAVHESGVVSINSHSSVHVEAPFGGFKTSGIGRDLGMNAMDGYTELKNVYVAE